MKRSEMVNQINRELRAQSSGNTDIDGCQLLSFIEAAGMIPPKATSIKMVSHRVDHWGNEEDFPTEVSIGNKWESEDAI